MAKLFRQAFRQKTHDESDTSMRELGATGVFQNMAFQEIVDDAVTTPATPSKPSKKEPSASCNQLELTPEPPSPTSQEIPQGAEMWASPPATPSMAVKRISNNGNAWIKVPPSPTAAKRAASTSAGQTPKAHRLSLIKLPRKITEVEDIAARDIELEKGTPAAGIQEDAESSAQPEVPIMATPWTLSPHPRGCTPSAVRIWEEEVKRLLTAGRVEDAVRWAAPSDGIIRCTVRRVKNFMGHTQSYHLFLDSGDTFVLAARKRKKSTSSNYVLSTSQDDLSRDSEHRIAKLRSNFVGTEYSLVSRGCSAARPGSAGNTGRPHAAGVGVSATVRPENPLEETPAAPADAASPSSSSGSRQHQDPFCVEEMAVHYKQTALTAKGGPRIMLVATPLPDSNWTPSAPDGSDSLTNCLEAARRRELAPRRERQLCMLATRPPEWDSALKAYTLDFHGRVQACSVKNFQLVHWDHNTDRKGSDLVLQFGKISHHGDDFALDFAYPLTLQKAFGIALASTDAKLCYAL